MREKERRERDEEDIFGKKFFLMDIIFKFFG